MSLSSDLTAIKNLSDGVKNNKVTRFAYTQNAYNNNDVNGHDDYVYDRDNNIPTSDLSVIEVNQTVVDKGFRARASSLTRMLLNHLFGRISYNLNKVNDLFNELLVKVLANMGVANGLATLDANGRIPYSQLPEDAMEYQGEWNAETNTPHLADGNGTRGDTYNVSVAGTQTFGGQSIYFFVGDRVIYNENGVWQRLESGNIQSVCGILPDQNTGNVDLTQQTDIFKILNPSSDFMSKLLLFVRGRYWKQATGVASNAVVGWVAEGNGMAVAITTTGLFWSEDGKHWNLGSSQIKADSYYEYAHVLYANGIWVAETVNNQGVAHTVFWSENGKDWTEGNLSEAGADLSFQNGLWHFLSYGSSRVFWSEDGKSWTMCSGVERNRYSGKIKYVNGLWFTGSWDSDTQGYSYYSTDGKAWSRITGTLNSEALFDVIYENGIYTGCGTDGCYWSSNGTSWSKGTCPAFLAKYLLYANGIYIAGGKSNNNVGNFGLAYSTDGKNWTAVTISGSSSLGDINKDQLLFANGWFVAGNNNNGILKSSDGMTWRKSGAYCDNFISFKNGTWLAGSDGTMGVIWSFDTNTWTAGKGIPAQTSIRFLTQFGGIVIAGSPTAGLWYADPIEYIDGE